jgi:hypothetical protein
METVSSSSIASINAKLRCDAKLTEAIMESDEDGELTMYVIMTLPNKVVVEGFVTTSRETSDAANKIDIWAESNYKDCLVVIKQ